MMKQGDMIEFGKISGRHLAIPLLIYILTLVFRNQLYGVFGEQNYVGIHLMMQMFIIVVSFTIAIQAWLSVPYTFSNQRLYIGSLFFFLGLLEVIHALSYKGMPFLIEESSTYTSTWFYMISRVTQAFGLLVIFTFKPKKIQPGQRWIAYSLAILFAVAWMFIIFNPHQLLPVLVVDGMGTTALKNVLQYLAILLQFIMILYLFKHFYTDKNSNTMIIIASVNLILADSMFTSYNSIYDIRNFIGHLYQLLGYYFLFKSIYYSYVQEPFESLLETKKELEDSRESLQFMAYHNELTGLPNSRFLTEKLTKELKTTETEKAMIMIQIDRLQAIKESLGHSFKDLILQKVSARLRDNLPIELFISNMNEDFVIILPSIAEKEGVVGLCKHIQEVMKEPFQVRHILLKVTLNIGIVVCPNQGKSEEELMRHAQVAMGEAQKVSERYMFYRSEMDQHLEERMVLEHDLHHALEKEELYLEYQPQIDVRTGHIHSVEALIRWQHPEKGLISPATFIPIAEETGLIVPIGEWVLKTACKQVKKWHDEGIYHMGVGVNLSMGQFFQQNLVQIVEEILVKTNLSPNFLELEITESMTMDTNHAIEILQDLKRLGVKIAIDDFGTGYSSISYLKNFPIDTLKIDQSFIREFQSDFRESALISMIISIAKHLELKVIAEGVEEVDQLSFLAKRDCDSIQGYLFSRPISPEEFSLHFNEIQKKAITGLEELYTDLKEKRNIVKY